MIRLVRSSEIPKSLAVDGPAKALKLAEMVAQDRDLFTSGQQSLPMDRNVYAHADVKHALLAMQHGKCFLCESAVQITSHGDVEHFRPKGGSRQEPGAEMERPGYYWLAYDWGNLFLSCEVCNRSFKKNLFPLLNPNERAKAPADDLERELPIFIDPSREEPADFLAFRGAELYAIGDNERGRKTIEWLGLDRDILSNARAAHYDRLKCLYDIVHHIPPVSEALRASAEQRLTHDAEEGAPYLMMVRTAIAAGFEGVRPTSDGPLPAGSE